MPGIVVPRHNGKIESAAFTSFTLTSTVTCSGNGLSNQGAIIQTIAVATVLICGPTTHITQPCWACIIVGILRRPRSHAVSPRTWTASQLCTSRRQESQELKNYPEWWLHRASADNSNKLFSSIFDSIRQSYTAQILNSFLLSWEFSVRFFFSLEVN